MWHRVRLSNGSTLLLREDADELTLALDGGIDSAPTYLATIGVGSIDVHHHAGDAADTLVRGLQSTASVDPPAPPPEVPLLTLLWLYEDAGIQLTIVANDKEHAIDAVLEHRGGDKHSQEARTNVGACLRGYDLRKWESRVFPAVLHERRWPVTSREQLDKSCRHALEAVQQLRRDALGESP